MCVAASSARIRGMSLPSCHSWTRRASRSCRPSGSTATSVPSAPGLAVASHSSHSSPRRPCSRRNASTFSRFPTFATRNPYPSSVSFSTTLSTAEFAPETMPTVFPWATRVATRLRIVCVLPVPGGPSITESWCDSAALRALRCSRLEAKGMMVSCSAPVLALLVPVK